MIQTVSRKVPENGTELIWRKWNLEHVKKGKTPARS
jgi:hypothetical protein